MLTRPRREELACDENEGPPPRVPVLEGGQLSECGPNEEAQATTTPAYLQTEERARAMCATTAVELASGWRGARACRTRGPTRAADVPEAGQGEGLMLPEPRKGTDADELKLLSTSGERGASASQQRASGRAAGEAALPGEGESPWTSASASGPSMHGQAALKVSERDDRLAVVGSLARHLESWRRVQAPRSVLSHIECGVPLRWEMPPPAMRRAPRNACFTDHERAFVESEINELVRVRAIERGPELRGEVYGRYWSEVTGDNPEAESFVRRVSPLGVVPKGEGGLRLIYNMSRLTEFIYAPTFRHVTMGEVLRFARESSWMLTCDIRSGFHHLFSHPDSRPDMGILWESRLYRWNVLPFGSRVSPSAFCATTAAMVGHLRATFGLRVTVFVDDLAVFGDTPEELLRDRARLEAAMIELGFVRHTEKGAWQPVQVCEYLGWEIDLRDHTVRPTARRVEKLTRLCDAALMRAVPGSRVPVHFVQQLAGTWAALELALPRCRMLARALHAMVSAAGRATRRVRWTTWTAQARDAISALRARLPTWLRSGWMFAPKTRVTVLEVSTDASGDALGLSAPALGIAETVRLPASAVAGRSTNFRELLALVAMFDRLASRVQRVRVRVLCDSSVAKRCFEVGSRTPELQRLVLRCWDAIERAGLDVEMRWISSEDNATADELSRPREPSDWRVSRAVFEQAQKVLRLDTNVDAFAQSTTTMLPCYWTRADDAFTHDWSRSQCWLNPPTGAVGMTLRHLKECGARALLLAPIWRGRPWWPTLCRMTEGALAIGSGAEIVDREWRALAAERGACAEVERNPMWRFAVFLVDGTRTGPFAEPRWL